MEDSMSDHVSVKVDVHDAHGRVYARSEDLPGLILSHDDRQTLLSIVPEAIQVLYRHRGFAKVEVTLGSSSPNIEHAGTGFQRYDVELSK
jgi:hypothetical protein